MTPTVKFTVLTVLLLGGFALSRNAFWRGLFIGFAIVYILKYFIFGLAKWDGWFHPERIKADTTGPYAAFALPLLQGAWK
jgi:hypothetical protein